MYGIKYLTLASHLNWIFFFQINLFKLVFWLQGLSTLSTEPLLIGISVSSLDKAFRIVDIGPDAENKEEVYEYLLGIISQLFLLMHVLILLFFFH